MTYAITRPARERRPTTGAGAVHALPILALTAAVVLVSGVSEPWLTMLLMVAALIAGFKWWMWRVAVSRARPHVRAPLAYALGWIGMDCEPFLAPPGHCVIRPAAWLRAAAVATAGGVMLIGVTPRVSLPLAAGWVGMIGAAMVLHFGGMELLALAWRARGRAVTPVMRRPLRSTSLADFWGNRWNTAFHAIAERLFFRPMLRHGFSGPAALMGTFVVSGILHELVISVPARAGFGWPTVYFTLQGLGCIVERSRAGQRLGLRAGVRGWLWTAAVVIAPVPLLFHEPFVVRVVLPFLHVIGVR